MAAARAFTLMPNSFCDTASCRSLASLARSSINDSSRLRSYSLALVSAIAACAAKSERSSWSRPVKPPDTCLFREEDNAKHVLATFDRHPEEVGEHRMGRGKVLEPGIRAYVAELLRLALFEQDTQHAVLAR